MHAGRTSASDPFVASSYSFPQHYKTAAGFDWNVWNQVCMQVCLPVLALVRVVV
jgi:hypothetical protein